MLLDTSILVELLIPSDPEVQSRIRRLTDVQRAIHASPIHLGELADAARRKGLDAQRAIGLAMSVLTLIPLDPAIAVAGSAIKAEARKRKSGRDFSLIDGIGLATARSRGMPMITMDHEFDGFDDVTVIER